MGKEASSPPPASHPSPDDGVAPPQVVTPVAKQPTVDEEHQGSKQAADTSCHQHFIASYKVDDGDGKIRYLEDDGENRQLQDGVERLVVSAIAGVLVELHAATLALDAPVLLHPAHTDPYIQPQDQRGHGGAETGVNLLHPVRPEVHVVAAVVGRRQGRAGRPVRQAHQQRQQSGRQHGAVQQPQPHIRQQLEVAQPVLDGHVALHADGGQRRGPRDAQRALEGQQRLAADRRQRRAQQPQQSQQRGQQAQQHAGAGHVQQQLEHGPLAQRARADDRHAGHARTERDQKTHQQPDLVDHADGRQQNSRN